MSISVSEDEKWKFGRSIPCSAFFGFWLVTSYDGTEDPLIKILYTIKLEKAAGMLQSRISNKKTLLKFSVLFVQSRTVGKKEKGLEVYIGSKGRQEWYMLEKNGKYIC